MKEREGRRYGESGLKETKSWEKLVRKEVEREKEREEGMRKWAEREKWEEGRKKMGLKVRKSVKKVPVGRKGIEREKELEKDREKGG